MNEIHVISIVIPTYNEEGNIATLHQEITATMQLMKYDYEVLYINDGSIDNSWNRIEELSKTDRHVRGIDLAGNYGQTLALRTGFELAKGDVIIAMDGDLQHDPKYIPDLITKMEEGYEIVGGSKQVRPEGFFKSLLANLAHFTISRMTGVKMKYFGATFKAYRSYLLKDVNMLGDTHRYLGAIVARKGVRYTEIPIEIRSRGAGKSNYSIKKVFYVVIDLIFLKFSVSYMSKPFRLFGVLGSIILLTGLVPMIYYLISALFFNLDIHSHRLAEFLFTIFLTLFGVMLISFGFVAEIGIHNQYTRDESSPYRIRQITKYKVVRRITQLN
jgi:glycosyltransferase involved in cell wall biosynthesis